MRLCRLVVAVAWAFSGLSLAAQNPVPVIPSMSDRIQSFDESSKYMLLSRPEVKQELGIDDEQQKQLDAIAKERSRLIEEAVEWRHADAQRLQEKADLSAEEHQRLREKHQDARQALVEKLKLYEVRKSELHAEAFGSLYAEQAGRLEQIHLQSRGAQVLMRSDIADALKLTHAQVDTIRALWSDSHRSRPGDERQLATAKRLKLFQQRQETFNADARRLLTAEQLIAWDRMLGKKFELENRSIPPAPKAPPVPAKPED